METINETDKLKKTIQFLKIKQASELASLKEQYQHTYESLKPLNLIKNVFGQIATSSDLKGNILNSVVGISTGYLTKKILIGSTHNPIKRILGTVLQFFITNIVTKNSDIPKT
jgi:hypothetical protein